MDTQKVHFISGHLDLSKEEFNIHYRPRIDEALAQGDSFVVGDARGADTLAQQYLQGRTEKVVVFHMFEGPRNNPGSSPTVGGFMNDETRDEALTQASTNDIAWVRPGRERSGTAKNLARRKPGSPPAGDPHPGVDIPLPALPSETESLP